MWKQLAKDGNLSDLSRAATLGLTFAVGVAVFSFGGFLLDQRRGGGILFTLIGMFLGLAFGAYETWKVITYLNQKAAGHTRSSPSVPPDDTAPPSSRKST